MPRHPAKIIAKVRNSCSVQRREAMNHSVRRHRSLVGRSQPRLLCSVAVVLSMSVVAALGCANDSPRATTEPPPPPVPGPPPPVPSFTISGIVLEHTAGGRRPAGNVVLRVSSVDLVVTTTSDADGRYSASVRGDRVSIAPEESDSYMSPCPSGTNWLVDNRTIDVDVVSKLVLSTTGVPDSYPRTSIYVTGTIIEGSAEGPRPVAGALVGLGFEAAQSTTLSDALGRFVVCTAPPGSGTDQLIPLRVVKDGYLRDSSFVLGGWDDRVSVQLVRNR